MISPCAEASPSPPWSSPCSLAAERRSPPRAPRASPGPRPATPRRRPPSRPRRRRSRDREAPRRPGGGHRRLLLTENDCQALGRQYGDAARADQRVGLNPKLTAKQREQADASIDSVVSKLEAGWTDTCLKNLAGKNVEHEKIECALAAKTVKSFDVCLNGHKGP